MTLTAGDADTWTETLPGIDSADGYVVRFVVRRAGIKHELAATGSGESWTATVSSAFSSKLAPGQWQRIIVATLDGERETVRTDLLTVSPDPQGDDPFAALRSDIANAEAALSKRLKGEVVENFSLRGQSVSLMPVANLKAFINTLKAELRQRISAMAGGNQTFVGQVKFS